MNKAVTGLVRALDDEDWRIQGQALMALARIGPGASIARRPVLALLEHPHTDVSGFAATALGKFGVASEPVLNALVRMLNDPRPDWSPRVNAVLALLDLGPAAAPAARDLARHLSWPQPLFVSAALERMGTAAIPGIEAFLEEEDPPPEVRKLALEVIDRIRED